MSNPFKPNRFKKKDHTRNARRENARLADRKLAPDQGRGNKYAEAFTMSSKVDKTIKKKHHAGNHLRVKSIPDGYEGAGQW